MVQTKNKQIKQAYRQYLTATAWDIRQVYETCSDNKRTAWATCEHLAKKYGDADGFHSLRIIAYNTFSFSAGFIGTNPQTGDLAFFWVTKDNLRYCNMDILEEEFGKCYIIG